MYIIQSYYVRLAAQYTFTHLLFIFELIKLQFVTFDDAKIILFLGIFQMLFCKLHDIEEIHLPKSPQHILFFCYIKAQLSNQLQGSDSCITIV